MGRPEEREIVYTVIDGERDYQDSLWGGRPHDEMKSVGDFLVFIDQYIHRAKEDLTTVIGSPAALNQIRKIAALAVACMEYNGAPERDV